ncbi:MAG: hypothetical protein DHS20C11_11760 [Lysobacteraceae bacterium]|nr:MAG: hypothetical protein DHS20C11_11760 [Xanthomonadaceae bacterium]
MSIDRRLLETLACPVGKVSLKLVSADRLAVLNDLIAKGDLVDVDGRAIDQPLQQALITVDDKVIYPIDDDIPVLLPDRGIGTQQIKEW